MVNLNLNVQTVPFFDSVKNPLTAAADSASFVNNGYDNLALEISGSGSGTFAVEGCVNTLNAQGGALEDSQISWTPLMLISAEDFKSHGTATTNGIYYVAVAGISKVRVCATNVSGNNTIVGTFTK